MCGATRRSALRLAGLGLGSSLAGCLDAVAPGSDDPETATENPGGTPTDTPGTTAMTPDSTPTETTEAGPELAVDPADLPGEVRPDADPQTVPDALVCEEVEAFERHPPLFDEDEFVWGIAREAGVPKFALRVDALEVERGDKVTVTLTYLRTETGVVTGTGNKYKYHLQMYTTEGWQEVRGIVDEKPVVYTDELVEHGPGEGFEWNLTLTEDGLLDGHPHGEELTVCPGLSPGRYRFVYWGVDGAVGVAFDLVD